MYQIISFKKKGIFSRKTPIENTNEWLKKMGSNIKVIDTNPIVDEDGRILEIIITYDGEEAAILMKEDKNKKNKGNKDGKENKENKEKKLKPVKVELDEATSSVIAKKLEIVDDLSLNTVTIDKNLEIIEDKKENKDDFEEFLNKKK
ncbi:MAG: hypothetical protein LBT51_09880 [Fusobacteriaceae bacterium]|jgi:hypothetical protein|nr:hypothetical protein [Fusobacteriaceae bacterium]